MSGGMTYCSQRGARGQPRKAPSSVPMTNAISVVTVSSTMVHGSASSMMLVTVRG